MNQPRSLLGAGASCVIVSLCLASPFATTLANAQTPDENVAGLGAGAIVIQSPKGPGAGAQAWFMLDEDTTTGWTSDPGSHLEPTVIELADRSTIRSVQFDTASIE